jgi:hypothetical protein
MDFVQKRCSICKSLDGESKTAWLGIHIDTIFRKKLQSL